MNKARISRILIIDDNEDIHDDIKKILQPRQSSGLDALIQNLTGTARPENGFFDVQIDSAFQGEQGIGMVRQAKLEKDPYALVFVDIRIPPGLDGLETIRRLQQEDELLQYVIITAYSDYSWSTLHREIGQSDNLLVLKKPFEAIEIRQSASTLVEKWSLAKEREDAQKRLIQLKKMETVSSMASGLAHDFNNLLMSVIGNVELAQINISKDHGAYELLQNAQKALIQTKDLTQKFLLLSRFDFVEKRVSSPAGLLTAVTKTVFQESTVAVELQLPENLFDVVVDSALMTEGLQEILTNAKEAMPDGGKITISAENHFAISTDNIEKKSVRIIIKDQGYGISPENLSRVFDPYFSKKTRSNIKGMGMGLTVVAAIVSQHHGDIRIESEQGAGTTVYLELPATDKSTLDETDTEII